jgi:putative hydrolase of the HAD superfamily
MGIVSNAQVFTPCLVEDLLVGKSLTAGGFDLDLCIFSNRFRQAKPGPRLFDVLREGLTRRGILPHEAVYVGNDMLNDVWAASQAGLQTAWFAGDARSCRRREDDPRCRSLRPNVVLTNLVQLIECLEIKQDPPTTGSALASPF